MDPDDIANACLQTYLKKFPHTLFELNKEWTVLSGIVMEQGNQLVVLSLAYVKYF